MTVPVTAKDENETRRSSIMAIVLGPGWFLSVPLVSSQRRLTRKRGRTTDYRYPGI